MSGYVPGCLCFANSETTASAQQEHPEVQCETGQGKDILQVISADLLYHSI